MANEQQQSMTTNRERTLTNEEHLHFISSLYNRIDNSIRSQDAQSSAFVTCEEVLLAFAEAFDQLVEVKSVDLKKEYANVMLRALSEIIERDDNTHESRLQPQYAAGGQTQDHNLYLCFATDREKWRRIVRSLERAVRSGALSVDQVAPLQSVVYQRPGLYYADISLVAEQPPEVEELSEQRLDPLYPFVKIFTRLWKE